MNFQRVGEWRSRCCKNIRFNQGSNSHRHLPGVVFVEFDGPEKPAWEGINPSWVPIVLAVARQETKARKVLTYMQLPLKMARGITIHKSQGLTLEKVVVDFGEKDFLQAYLLWQLFKL
jgi:ATP-dependent exoDNAse (exonuclease V) alpha subunit